MIQLANAVVVSSQQASATEAKAVSVLIEEISKRTGITLKRSYRWPTEQVPVIIVGSEPLVKEFMESFANDIDSLERPGAEGYRILQAEAARQPVVFVIGTDERGVLFGIGKLLRKLHLTSDQICLDAGLRIASTPGNQLRGHQLGYRPKTNAYDAWSKDQFEQYIRELALFGANSIEILPPKTDDELTSIHMKVEALEMMAFLSGTIASYGLDVWIWWPLTYGYGSHGRGEDDKQIQAFQAELEEREHIISKLARVDHVLIPGGDPGEFEPDVLFELSEKMTRLVQTYHPQAKMWISPQCFQPKRQWVDDFIDNVRKEPDWLGGIVHGPWERTPLPELRQLIPDKYPIRNYPDITHNYTCQFPVPDWDLAFALTQGRECINPRPRAMKHIHNMFERYTIGSLCYSEGIYDDVNKFIWSDQDWDSSSEADETLRDYVRLFISDEWTEEISSAIMALERNWEGPLILNDGVETTLRQWQAIESKASGHVLNNYRFQMGLMRAYYDAYLKRRLMLEKELENEAVDVMKTAASIGALAVLDKAEAVLNKAFSNPVASELRTKCSELADRLFDTIGAQPTVERHGAQSWRRGAFMEDIDMPLNDSQWILAKCGEVRGMKTEEERLAAIEQIWDRTNPGPGGYYDNLGSQASWGRIERKHRWEQDPEYYESPLIAYTIPVHHLNEAQWQDVGAMPLAWLNQATTHYTEPLTVTYDHLDTRSNYVLKVTYVGYIGGPWSGKFRLLANNEHLIHEELNVKHSIVQREFPIPQEAVMHGRLELTWQSGDGELGPYVAEIWLMKSHK